MNFCSPVVPQSGTGGRKRWAGLSKIGKRILFKESSNFVQKTPPNNQTSDLKTKKDGVG